MRTSVGELGHPDVTRSPGRQLRVEAGLQPLDQPRAACERPLRAGPLRAAPPPASLRRVGCAADPESRRARPLGAHLRAAHLCHRRSRSWPWSLQHPRPRHRVTRASPAHWAPPTPSATRRVHTRSTCSARPGARGTQLVKSWVITWKIPGLARFAEQLGRARQPLCGPDTAALAAPSQRPQGCPDRFGLDSRCPGPPPVVLQFSEALGAGQVLSASRCRCSGKKGWGGGAWPGLCVEEGEGGMLCTTRTMGLAWPPCCTPSGNII